MDIVKPNKNPAIHWSGWSLIKGRVIKGPTKNVNIAITKPGKKAHISGSAKLIFGECQGFWNAYIKFGVK